MMRSFSLDVVGAKGEALPSFSLRRGGGKGEKRGEKKNKKGRKRGRRRK